MKERWVAVRKALPFLVVTLGMAGWGVYLFLAVYHFVPGPPFYERWSKEYLLEHKYSSKVVDRLLNYKPLGSNTVARLTAVPETSVRVMLARNPHLTFDERQVLWQDKNEYVRQNLAGNLRLSQEEMDRVLQERGDTFWEKLSLGVFPRPRAAVRREQHRAVLEGMAGNLAEPRETLLQVLDEYRKRGYGRSRDGDHTLFLFFAQNPNCPKEIISKMPKRNVYRM